MDRSFLKHAATYGLATLLVQAGGFVLLPLYLRCLSEADNGVLELVGRLAETVGTLLLLGGFRQALFTFYQQAGEELERRRVVTTAYLLIATAALIGALIFGVLTPWLSSDEVPAWLLYLAVAGILLEPFSLLPLTLIQARIESATYTLVVVAQFVVRVGLCFVLIRLLNWGVAGALSATALVGLGFGLLLSGRELARGIAWPSWLHVREMLAFALPLLPGGLCFFVLHNGDRFVLRGWATLAEIGIYAVGYKLAMIARLTSLVPFYMVWSSRMYAVAKENDAPRIFGQVFTRVMAAYLFAGLAVCLFAQELLTLLGGARWSVAAAVVPPIVLACGLQAAATLMDAAFFLRRRTSLKLAVTVYATLAMLLCYAVFIPWLGIHGAALATVLGFAVLLITTWSATQRIFYVDYEWRRLAGLFTLAIVLLALGWGFPLSVWGIVAKSVLLLCGPLAAWLLNLVTAEEKLLLRHLVSAALPSHASIQSTV